MRPVRVAVAGSVDDGKSTLLGRLMCDADKVFGDEVEAVKKASLAPTGGESRGAGLNLAFFTDGLTTERRDGITLDVAWRHLTLGSNRLLLADVPGHAELVRNMATGASTADAALLLVDAERGLQPQTRRHLVMLFGLGVKRVVVCINKMDAIGFNESVAISLASALRSLADALGVKLEVIPVSALQGDNIVRRSERMPWYAGPTVAELLATIDPIADATGTRSVVQLDSDSEGWTALQGEVSDELTAWPGGAPCRVLERSPHGVGRVRLQPPQSRGTLLTSEPPLMSAHVTLIVTWLGPTDCVPGLSVKLLQQARQTPGRIVGKFERVNRESGAFETATSLTSGDVGRVHLELERETWFALAVLVDDAGQTIAGARFS